MNSKHPMAFGGEESFKIKQPKFKHAPPDQKLPMGATHGTANYAKDFEWANKKVGKNLTILSVL